LVAFVSDRRLPTRAERHAALSFRPDQVASRLALYCWSFNVALLAVVLGLSEEQVADLVRAGLPFLMDPRGRRHFRAEDVCRFLHSSAVPAELVPHLVAVRRVGRAVARVVASLRAAGEPLEHEGIVKGLGGPLPAGVGADERVSALFCLAGYDWCDGRYIVERGRERVAAGVLTMLCWPV